jgi:hypothetical protein
MNKALGNLISVTLLIMFSSWSSAQESAGMTIVGDQELPQVLYIVPWQTPVMPVIEPPKMSGLHHHLRLPCQVNPSEITQPAESLWPCRSHAVTPLVIEK